MRKMDFLNKLYAGIIVLCGMFAFSGCEAGLTYEEAPESYYSEVGVTEFRLQSRELFEDKVYAVNWEQWVENYLDTRQISWECTTTTESNSDAPGGTLYVLNVKANPRVTYQTPNKGYLFDGSKFSGDFELVDPTDNRSQKVTLPVKQNEVIGEIYLVNSYNCVVERVDNATELGKPGDFSKPQRYLVKNICYRPAGVEQYTRLYEVRVTFAEKK